MGKLRQNGRLRRIYMGYINDGIIDIFVGMILFFGGLMLLTSTVWMTGAYIAIFLPVVWSAKEKITFPRLRVEEIRQNDRTQNGWMVSALVVGLLAASILAVAIFLLYGRSGLTTVSREVVSFITTGFVGVAVLGGFFVIGVLYNARRWFVYAISASFFAAAAWLLGIELPWELIAMGTIISIGGFICLFRFLDSHPVRHEGDKPAL